METVKFYKTQRDTPEDLKALYELVLKTIEWANEEGFKSLKIICDDGEAHLPLSIIKQLGEFGFEIKNDSDKLPPPKRFYRYTIIDWRWKPLSETDDTKIPVIPEVDL